jgi:hypothetical protein
MAPLTYSDWYAPVTSTNPKTADQYGEKKIPSSGRAKKMIKSVTIAGKPRKIPTMVVARREIGLFP